MNLSHYMTLFLDEGREWLYQLNDQLLRFEQAPLDRELAKELYRTVHSFKGLVSTMGMNDLTELTHAMENVLEGLRSGQIPPDPGFADVLLRCMHAMDERLRAIESGQEGELDVQGLRLELERMRGTVPLPAEAPPDQLTSLVPAISPGDHRLAIELTLEEHCMLKAVRAQLILSLLEHDGQLLEVSPPPEALEAADPPRMRLLLLSHRPAAEIRSSLRDLDEVHSVEVVEVPETGRSRTLRVSADRLAELSRLAERLAAELDTLAPLSGESEVSQAHVRLGSLVSALQHELASLRLMPAESFFMRFPPMIENLGRELGKEVEVLVSAPGVDLEPGLLEELSEPLIHLLRNALDHGLEPPAERLAAGKPARGRIRLVASRHEGAIHLAILDDGRGLDRGRIRAKAIATGVIDPEQADTLPDAEIDALIFAPGFSTASQVTHISGRGFGMDVVLSKINSLGGTIQVDTTPGQGSCFRISLPVQRAGVMPA